MQIIFQANDDDYMHNCSPQLIVGAIKTAVRGHQTYYAHVYYGSVSSQSPLLSFACFPGEGVYVCVKLDRGIWIYVDSDDYEQSFPIQWGQDSVVMPRAYLMPATTATGIVQYFCETGDFRPDSHWHQYESLSWNLYSDE